MDLKIRKNKQSYTTIDMYNYYLSKNIDSKVSYVRFKRIIDEMYKIILDHIQNRSECFKMPCGLGFIMIIKYKPKSYNTKSLSVDYKQTQLQNKRIYHLNEHSNGYKYRLFWSKQPYTFADRYKYQLSFVRENKRRLAKLIFNRQDYIDINDIQIYKM